MTSYNPKFHKNNTITYWHQKHGWIRRVHPLKISGETLTHWRKKDVERRTEMINRLWYLRYKRTMDTDI